nr:outer mitochondrial transmembrane helix translocase-like [Procambarus clarkii]
MSVSLKVKVMTLKTKVKKVTIMVKALWYLLNLLKDLVIQRDLTDPHIPDGRDALQHDEVLSKLCNLLQDLHGEEVEGPKQLLQDLCDVWRSHLKQDKSSVTEESCTHTTLTSTEESSSDEDGLNEFERQLLCCLKTPQEIVSTWEAIGGHEDILEEIDTQVAGIIKFKKYFPHNPCHHPPSMLLYGPPGCGKTMIAEAVAKSCGINLLTVTSSLVTSKWHGESEKLLNAVFTLAYKRQPAGIFIDELDTFFSKRGESEVRGYMLGTFLTNTNDFDREPDKLIFIIAATNRMDLIDSAILRRFPLKLNVNAPNFQARRQILKLCLQKYEVDSYIDLESVAKLATNCSGDDLKNIVEITFAALIRQYIRECCESDKDKNSGATKFHQRHDRVALPPITQQMLKRQVILYKKRNM